MLQSDITIDSDRYLRAHVISPCLSCISLDISYMDVYNLLIMNYLTIITPQYYTAIVLNVKKFNHVDINQAYAISQRMGCVGVLSNYKDVFKADFKRRKDNGEILLSDLPQRLDTEALLAYLEQLAERLQKKRKCPNIHPNSLANLKQSARFTSENRPNKPRIVQDEQVKKAHELREKGLSWKSIGDLLGLNVSTIRSAVRLEAMKSAKNKAEIGELRG